MSRILERRGGRPKAREVALRVLYEVDLTGDDPREALALALGRFRFTEEGREHARRLVHGFLEAADRVDGALAGVLQHWELDRLGGIERALLRLAVTELLLEPGVPAAVVLEETLRLAHRYGDERSPAFVNGVLDAAARSIRPGELAPPEGRG